MYCFVCSEKNLSNVSPLLILFNIIFVLGFCLEIEIQILKMSSCRILMMCHVADMHYSEKVGVADQVISMLSAYMTACIHSRERCSRLRAEMNRDKVTVAVCIVMYMVLSS